MTNPPPPPDPVAFRRAMGRWATGVSVVTARDGTTDAGLTVNALVSVSLRPPSLLVSLMREVDTLPVIERSRTFAVSFLAHDQKEVSERFAATTPSIEKFRGLSVHRGSTGAALIDGAIGVLECELVEVVPAFDHRLVLGRVVRHEPGRDELPLVFYQSGYAASEGPDRLRFPRERPVTQA